LAPLRSFLFCLVTNIFLMVPHLVEAKKEVTSELPDIQSSTCIVPNGKPNAPLSGIYLHGWFDSTNTASGFYVDLERSNRAQLQKLSDELGIRIAVPVAKETRTIRSKSGVSRTVRTWNPSQAAGSAAKKLKAIEAESEKACGATLAKPRSLIGFSDGGYLARELALQCATKTDSYSKVLMIGAAPRFATTPKEQNCADFLAVRGEADSSTSPCVQRNNSGVCLQRGSFRKKAQAMMKSFGGNGALLPNYSGGHVLPPLEVLKSIFPQESPPTKAQEPEKAQ